MTEERVLSFDRVAAGDDEPERWLYMLHGVFGAGRNWASLARRVVRARPEWGVLLVDLREHGASQGFRPPHTIAAAAADLTPLATASGAAPAAVLGHSFGGKVAMAYLGGAAPPLRQLWVVDSTPETGPPRGSAWEMLRIAKALPPAFADRDAAIDALVDRGVAPPVAQWMATNLEAADGAFRWRFDLASIEALLRDFFRTDTWSALEAPPHGVEVHVVKAEASSVLSGDTLARVERAADTGHVVVHRVAGGHWVNAENPDAMVDLLVHNLP